MTCDDVRELTRRGPLRTLVREERLAVLAHLEVCGLHPGLAEALDAAPADALPGTTDERPLVLPGLRREPATEVPAQVAVVVRALPWLLAAGFAVLALAGWLRPSGSAVPQPEALVFFEAPAVVGASRGTVTYDPSSGLMLFAASGLPPAPPDSEYQLWLVRGTTPLSLGTFTPTSDGRASVAAELRIARGEVLAVTLEALGGSPAPTSAPFLAITYR
ncbi:MAG: anti-sigma factor [Dehalococcoidia bacterium]|nr:anti-sigma factor [Dehalococcoidia bacterium]